MVQSLKIDDDPTMVEVIPYIYQRIFREELKKEIFSNFKKITRKNRLKRSNNSDSNFLEIRCAQRMISQCYFSIDRHHGTKTRHLGTRLKINASQTIPRSNNLYMVSTNGEVKKKKTIWKNNRRGERIVPNIANDKWKAIGRTQARTRDNTAIPSSRKGNNEQKARLLQGFISYPQPTSRTRWSILEKSDNKRLAGYKLFNCSILAQGISRR